MTNLTANLWMIPILVMLVVGAVVVMRATRAAIKSREKSLSRAQSLQELPRRLPYAHAIPTTAVVVFEDSFNFTIPLLREVFSGVLEAGREYDITITGVVQDCVIDSHRYATCASHADAFYYEDNNGNFTLNHNALRVDDSAVRRADLISADRELHRYTLRFVGKGRKLAFCFGFRRHHTEDPPPQGSLHVSIQESAASIAARAETEAQERATASMAGAERQARIAELEALKDHEPYLADPAHLEKYAAKNKNKLLGRRIEIRQEDLAFRTYLLPMLKEQGRNDLIPFGEWERKALAIAEHFDVEGPRKPKLTAEEIRAFKVRRDQVKFDDKIALRKARIDAILKARAFLDQYDLDPGEREVHEQELIDDILGEDDSGGHTKII